MNVDDTSGNLGVCPHVQPKEDVLGKKLENKPFFNSCCVCRCNVFFFASLVQPESDEADVQHQLTKYHGHGADVDILYAAAKAYIHSVNRIISARDSAGSFGC